MMTYKQTKYQAGTKTGLYQTIGWQAVAYMAKRVKAGD
jgi:hypothetical protein